MSSFIIFDLDGTLVNTLGDLTFALNHALVENGFPVLSEHEVSAIIGHSGRYMCQNAVPREHADEWEKVLASYSAFYHRHCCDRACPYEGMPRAVKRLKDSGKRLAVVSNKAHADAVNVISALYPRDTFSMVLGRMQRFTIKPAPDALYFAMDYFGEKPEDTVYVGDSEVDVEFARNAGVPCLSASWGFRTRAELIAAGATRILDDPGELPELLL